MSSIKDYVNDNRKAGFSDADIKAHLVASGWPEKEAEQALNGNALPPAPPYRPARSASQPIAVVENYTTHGLEYSIMAIALFFTATSLGALVHAAVRNAFSTANLTPYSGQFASALTTSSAATLIVCAPIFLLLFYRLRGLEKTTPQLHNDPTRRKAVQWITVLSFVIGLFHIFGYVATLLDADAKRNFVEQTLHLLVTLTIAGGIFAYGWKDQHRQES